MTSLVTQMAKNVPAMQETRVRPLGWEKPLEKEMAIHSSILAWEIPLFFTSINWVKDGKHALILEISEQLLTTLGPLWGRKGALIGFRKYRVTNTILSVVYVFIKPQN